MTTTAPSGAPTPQTDAEKLLGEEGGLPPKLLKELGETREAASAVISGVEREPYKRVSFADAAKVLSNHRILVGGIECSSLEDARVNVVRQHGLWGYVDALKKMGVVSSSDQYGALFDKATLNDADLQKVEQQLKSDVRWTPNFDVGSMDPNELFAVLFTNGGVPRDKGSYGYKNLAKLRRIDPKDIPDLANLAGKPYDEQSAAFIAAYREADPLEPTGPRVTFTLDKRQVTLTGTSATKEMQAYAKGEMAFVDPNADMIRFRTKMDAGLRRIAGIRGNFDGMDDAAYRKLLKKAFKDETIDEYMPDYQTATRYPNFAFENGLIPGLSFGGPGYHMVGVDCAYPADVDNVRGSRVSLG